MGRLVILSGPSCAGKGPLLAAMRKFHPDLWRRMTKVVLYNSRSPRPAEVDGVDYHFRNRTEIESLRERDDHVVMDVRGDLQALDVGALEKVLAKCDALFEGNPFVGDRLITPTGGIEVLSVFLSPLSKEEINALVAAGASAREIVTDVMRRRLLKRTTLQKGHLSLPDLADIERRATSAYDELKLARRFGHVIPNHDGEGSENWSAFYFPLADARRTLLAFVDLLEGRIPACAETWTADDPKLR